MQVTKDSKYCVNFDEVVSMTANLDGAFHGLIADVDSGQPTVER